MKRRLVAALLGLTIASAAAAGTSVSVNVQIGDSTPPVIAREPHVVLVPRTTVWVVQDDWDWDCFRHGGWWYGWRGGHWYRARHWKGPFESCETRLVPVAVTNVPQRHWRHHPSAARKVIVEPAGQRRRGPDVEVVKPRGKR